MSFTPNREIRSGGLAGWTVRQSTFNNLFLPQSQWRPGRENLLRVSLLVSTYNWPEALELLLLGVFRQSCLPDEILIADDGSDNRSLDLLESLRATTDVPIRHVWQEDAGYRKTLIVNKALSIAKGDYIIQVDGDVLLHRRFIEDHMTFAEAGRFIRGYRVHLDQAQSAAVLANKKIDVGLLEAGPTVAFKSIRAPLLSRVFRFDQPKYARVYGCNLSFWREDAISVNGYNNDFIGWGPDDAEFVARLCHIGLKRRKVRFAAKQYHFHHTESSRELLSQNKELLRDTIQAQRTFCRNGIIENYQP